MKNLYLLNALFCLLTLNSIAQNTTTSIANTPIKFLGFIGKKDAHNDKLVYKKDLDKSYVLKECTFFKGDSLRGFNFDSVAKVLDSHHFDLFLEFKTVMFYKQTDFIKNKYQITNLNTGINARGVGNNPPTTATSACTNLDFEDGNFGNWTVSTGYNANSNASLTIPPGGVGTGGIGTNLSLNDCSDVNLITAAYGNDAIGGFPGVDPNGGTTSARIGGFKVNLGNAGSANPNYNACPHWTSTSGSDGQILEQTFLVSASNALISFNYAVVLNASPHNNGEQPYFHVYIKNPISGAILSTCTEYYVQSPAQGAIPPGFVNSGYTNYDNSILYYQNWKSSSMNLTPYIGQNVNIEFVAAGCLGGAHPAWAYVDASCGPANLTLANLNPCENTTTTLSAPPVVGGTYSWTGPGIVGPNNVATITISASGTYTATIVPPQGAQCSYTISRVVNFLPIPVITNALNATTCSGVPVSVALSSSMPSNFSWVAIDNASTTGESLTVQLGANVNQTIINNSNTVSQAVTYTVTPIDVATGCVGYASNLNIIVDPTHAPTITSTNFTACSGASGVYTTSPSAGSTLVWTATGGTITSGQGSPAVSVTWGASGTGTIAVLETSNKGCKATATSAVTINALPTAPIITSIHADSVCFGLTDSIKTSATAGIVTNVFNVATGGTIIGTLNYQTPPIVANVTYYFETMFTATGCKSSINRDSIKIKVLARPGHIVPSFAPDSAICLHDTIKIKANGASATSVINWYNSATSTTSIGKDSITVHPTNSQYYYVEVINKQGCKASEIRDSVLVTVFALPTPIITTLDTNLCSGIVGTYTAILSAGSTLIWAANGGTIISGQNTVLANVIWGTTPPNTIKVTETNSNGCKVTATKTISVKQAPKLPVITTLFGDSVCFGLKDSIKTTSLPGVVTNVYSTANGGIKIGTLNYQTAPIVADVTYYFETVYTNTGCKSSVVRDSIKIKVINRPAHVTPSFAPDSAICLNDSTLLKALGTVAGTTINWYASASSTTSIGKDSALVKPTKSQYYYVEVKNKSGCKASEIRDSLRITVLPLPNLPKITGTVAPICEGDSVVIKASVNPSTNAIYWLSGSTWADTIAKGTTFTSPNITTSTTFYAATISTLGCRSSASVFLPIAVTVKPLPHVTVTSNATNNEIYIGENVQFDATPSTYDAYKWYIDMNEILVGGSVFETQDVKDEQIVKVLVKQNGCENLADNTIKIKVKSASNAFTPNGDGKNDLFLKGVDLAIFNRWGQVLYTGKDGWNGTYKGILAAPGTYFYTVKSKKSGSEDTIEKSGAVTLILD
jgi:large repetitive protein